MALIPSPVFPTFQSIIYQVLWNDPNPTKAGWSEGRGKSCYSFGRDVTAGFCRRNGLDAVIRAHEKQEAGYKKFHDG